MALGFAPVSKKASYPTTMSSSSSHHLIRKQQQTATTKFNYSSSKTRKNDRLCNCKLMSSLEQQPEDDTFSPPTTTTTPTPAIQSNHIEQEQNEQNELYKTFQLWYKNNLPPKPEDQLVLAGD
eukprot:10526096-Ditylum_brightwellii.AAC.1